MMGKSILVASLILTTFKNRKSLVQICVNFNQPYRSSKDRLENRKSNQELLGMKLLLRTKMCLDACSLACSASVVLFYLE